MKIKTRELVVFALLGAILAVSQIVLNFIPNVELVSTFIIIFSLIFGYKTQYSIFVFNIIMGILYGFGVWIIGYFIIWPSLSIITVLLKNKLIDNYLKMSIFCGAFGMIFGALYAIPYIVVNPYYALTYWISGLPYDAVHMLGNYFIMLLLGEVIYKTVCKLKHSSSLVKVNN